MTDPTPVPTPVRVTYAELAKARGVSLAAARKLALRHRWPKQVGNDGLAHVLVPASFMEDAGGRDVPGAGGGTGVVTGVPPDLRTTLEGVIAALRAERDAERERADRAERAAGVLRAKLVAARYAREVEVADLRQRLDAESEERRRLAGRRWWPWGRKLIGAVAVWVMACGPALADGNELLGDCLKPAGEPGRTFCLAYTAGVAHTLQLTAADVCLPEGSAQSQVHDAVVYYLQVHPELRDHPTIVLVIDALKEAFPCKR